MPETAAIDYVGVDVGQERLDYCVNEKEEGTCANRPAERAQLIARLKQLPHARVICEASGGYEKSLVADLITAGVEVCVVMPARVRAFAQAAGLLAKTDRIDARLLRQFGQKIELRLAQPRDATVAILRELIDHRRDLTTQLSVVEGKLPLAGATAGKLLRKQQAFLRKQIDAVEKMIRDHIDQDPDLHDKSERLQQMKGVGPVLSATLLAYVPELGHLTSAQVTSLIGLAPYAHDSAQSSRPRHVRGGRAPVRHVLYMAAVCAARCNPILAGFYQRLRSRGKPPMVCLVAVMRKMLCVLNRLLLKPDFTLAH